MRAQSPLLRGKRRQFSQARMTDKKVRPSVISRGGEIMNKNIILFLALIFVGAAANAQIHSCFIKKSLHWLDKDEKNHAELAQTKDFDVVSEIHEDASQFVLFDIHDQSGRGVVNVSTGAYVDRTGHFIKRVYAYLYDDHGKLLAQMASFFSPDTALARSEVMVSLPNRDRAPELSIECKLKESK